MLTDCTLPPPGLVGSSGNCWLGSSAMIAFSYEPLAVSLPNLRGIYASQRPAVRLVVDAKAALPFSLRVPPGLHVNHCDFRRLLVRRALQIITLQTRFWIMLNHLFSEDYMRLVAGFEGRVDPSSLRWN